MQRYIFFLLISYKSCILLQLHMYQSWATQFKKWPTQFNSIQFRIWIELSWEIFFRISKWIELSWQKFLGYLSWVELSWKKMFIIHELNRIELERIYELSWIELRNISWHVRIELNWIERSFLRPLNSIQLNSKKNSIHLAKE